MCTVGKHQFSLHYQTVVPLSHFTCGWASAALPHPTKEGIRNHPIYVHGGQTPISTQYQTNILPPFCIILRQPQCLAPVGPACTPGSCADHGVLTNVTFWTEIPWWGAYWFIIVAGLKVCTHWNSQIPLYTLYIPRYLFNPWCWTGDGGFECPLLPERHSLTGRVAMTTSLPLCLLLGLVRKTLAVGQCDIIDCDNDQRASWGYQASNGPVHIYITFFL